MSKPAVPGARFISSISLLLTCFVMPSASYGQYNPVRHRLPESGEIPVTEAGSYGIEGTTYILMNDITSSRSTIFLGKDVTLDLNGYTISYSDGNYDNIANGSFEDGIQGWDLSKAPSAAIEDTKIHVFIGNNILRLKAGEEIASSFIHLPLPDRSYFAMCGVATWEMRVSVYVEDDKGNNVKCITDYSDSTLISCPVENRSPRLGGGFVYAHLRGLPAGNYRVRVKAITDCLVDYIDIRPAMDVGIGIIEKTHPMGHNDYLYNRAHCAFFDYTDDVRQKIPIPGIPVVKGFGTVVIKNGIIRNATPGILSWGIQSTAEDVQIILDNLKIIASGINSTAVDVPQATDQAHSYSVFWSLTVKVLDKTGKVVNGADVKILDKREREMLNTKTSVDGTIQVQLPEYSFTSPEVTYNSPYKVIAGKKTMEVNLGKDMEVTIFTK